jgi:ATP-dependent helicase HrpB
MDFLPIDSHVPSILSTLRSAKSLVLAAPPGAGKTTRIPRALYDAGFAERGEILILEPRRLATRLAAARVAEELGEKTGETVGYSIRFENVAGPKTRIRFLTEAILARRMVKDPNLKGISAVILDEFHERHLATDLALAFLKRVQTANPGLVVIVMSATLDVEPVAAFLGNAQCLSIPGSRFDISIEYEERPSDRPLHEKVSSSVSRLLRDGLQGDILVFLPGAPEIRRSSEALSPLAERHGLLVLPLHGDLASSEQSRAIAPAAGRKVILSTNVAETSITIPGIAAVIDSGLVRMAGHSPWSGFPTLSTVKTSRASAIQRAGRAGRTQAGRVLRLYTAADFDSRPEYETPEIKRADLAETALLLHGFGIRDLHSFSWLDAPSTSAMDAAETILHRLGAVDHEDRITDIGRQMLHMPVHPRLARLVLEGRNQRVEAESALLAALLSERDIRRTTRTSFAPGVSRYKTGAAGESDVLELMDCFQNAESANFETSQVLTLGLDPGAIQSVRRAHRQLQRLGSANNARQASSQSDTKEGLLIAILSAFPDRVVKRRKAGSRELLLAGGGTATLATSSIVHHPMFAVAVDAEERREHSRNEPSVTVRIASAIEVEWLAGLFPDDIVEKTELIWNDRGKRVEALRRTSYDQIVIEDYTVPAPPSEEAAKILESVVWTHQLTDFRDLSSLPVFHAKLALLAQHSPGETFPEIGEKEIRDTIHLLCRGKTRMEELKDILLVDSLSERLTNRQRNLLARETPERIKLKAGRSVKIHYELSKPPWVESRLQDFFGMSATPSICSGQVPLTVHLLAPNGRAVQVTSDLAGFWQRHYASIRKELQRRYPKHSWPEL